jgi:hypothetical protein
MVSIPEVNEVLGQNWLNILSLLFGVIGVFGIPLSIILYFKSKKNKSPCFAVRSNNLISDSEKIAAPLKILYADQPVKDLTVAKILFWNDGQETIDKTDVVTSDPVKICIKGGYKILDAKLIFCNKKENGFSIELSSDQTSAILHFEYIDKDQGSVIQIFHTGKSSKDLEIVGTIKGVKNIIRRRIPLLEINSEEEEEPRRLSRKAENRIMRVFLFVAPIFIILINFVAPGFLVAMSAVSNPYIFIINQMSGVLLLIFFWSMGFYLFKRRIPADFEIFEENF